MRKKLKSIGPIRSIRRNCLKCCSGSRKEVELCPISYCPSHSYRFGKKPTNLCSRPLKAIRLECMECADTAKEVRKCPFPDCHLLPFRFGKNPALKGRRKNNVSQHVNPVNQEKHRADVGKIHSNKKVLKS